METMADTHFRRGGDGILMRFGKVLEQPTHAFSLDSAKSRDQTRESHINLAVNGKSPVKWGGAPKMHQSHDDAWQSK